MVDPNPNPESIAIGQIGQNFTSHRGVAGRQGAFTTYPCVMAASLCSLARMSGLCDTISLPSLACHGRLLVSVSLGRRPFGVKSVRGMDFTCNVCGTPVADCPIEKIDREVPSCRNCGSSVRFRSVVHLTSLAILGRSRPCLSPIPSTASGEATG
jgi:hypothetical protein